MEDIYDRIQLEKIKRKLNNDALGKVIDKSKDAFRMALSRKSLSKLEIEKLEQFFGIEQSESIETKAGSLYEDLGNGKYSLTVPFVPVRAQATYVSEYSDVDFIHDLSEVPFVVDRIGKGKYMGFEIQNDSMDDGTINSIPHGAIVLGRKVGKQHWKNKFHTAEFPYWIIVHQDTILCKEIIDHDVDKGIITCRSLNKSPEYGDFDLNLDEVNQLFNIVKKQL